MRVDSPADLRVERSSAGAGSEGLTAAKERGNQYVASSQFQAAADEYWQGLRSNAGEVAVLLSNRAQAQMKQQKWVDAMRDVAAALLLSPEDAKAWNRYSSALSGFGDEQLAMRARCVQAGTASAAVPEVSSVRAILSVALEAGTPLQISADGCNCATTLKQKGNCAYKQGDYSQADSCYTAALASLLATSEVVATLCNLSLCGLRTGMFHDAVAAAAASLQLLSTAKALHRGSTALALLGEFTLADNLLAMSTECSESHAHPKQFKECETLRRSIMHTKQLVGDGYPAEVVCSIAQFGLAPGSLVGEWTAEDRICTTLIEGKGRGAQALCDILVGETLIVQRARQSAETDLSSRQELLTSLNSSSRLVDGASQVRLKAQITAAASIHMTLASTLELLDDGAGKAKPLTSLCSFLDKLSPAVLPFFCSSPNLSLLTKGSSSATIAFAASWM